MDDRFIPSRSGGPSTDPMSPASPLAGGPWGRATSSTPRRRTAVRENFSSSAEGASALTWVVGTANDSAGRPGPIMHASVLREELLGGGGGSSSSSGRGRGSSSSSSSIGGGGAPEGGGVGSSIAGLDITSGWGDISLAHAPETVSHGSARHPAPPRLAAAAAASAAARTQHARAAALAGSPSRGGGGSHLLLAREEEDFLGYKENGADGSASDGAAHLAGILNTAPLDGTSHWGVSAAAICAAGGAVGGGPVTTHAPRVLTFGAGAGAGSSSISSSGQGFASPRASLLELGVGPTAAGSGGVGGLSALVALGARSEALLASPPLPKRRIAHVPYKVLDAPNLADDFYLNLLDWGSQNVVAVGLDKDMYLWNGYTANVAKLTSLSPPDKVTGVRWSGRGGHLMVGSDAGKVQLWDATNQKILRTLNTHKLRVGVGAWAGPVLATGSKDKTIHLHDVRSRTKVDHKLTAHTHEICGLEWSPDGAYLASGGNDNQLCIWSAAKLSTPLMSTARGDGEEGEPPHPRHGATPQHQPLHRFTQHSAAVKALAWCPHKSGLLASGGGTADKCIRFWSAGTGLQVGAVDTGSQVCQLAWSPASMELLSAHGYSTNTLVVWRFPSMSRLATLTGHTTRVLYMTVAPDGESVCTGAGDETIRFWRIFGRPPWVAHSTADADGAGGVGSTSEAHWSGSSSGNGSSRVERMVEGEDSFPTLLSDLPNVR